MSETPEAIVPPLVSPEVPAKEPPAEKMVPVSKDTIADLTAVMRSNPLVWGMFYCKEHFRLPPSRLHLELVKNGEICQFLCVVAPRGSAKSSILTFLKPLHSICWSKCNFIIIVQNTYSKAAQSVENIKNEIRNNIKLRRDFPVKFTKDTEGDTVFMINGHMTRVLAKGADQIGSVRGEKFGAYRPDLLLIDDLEDDEMVKNPELRIDLKKRFDEALLPAVDLKGKVLVVGTPLHDDSLIAHISAEKEYTDFKKIKFQAIMNGVSIWPQMWSMEWLKKKEANYPIVYAKEYMCDPVSGAMQRFHKEDFRYWDVIDGEAILYGASKEIISKYKLTDCVPAVACDLAWSEKRDADFTAIVPGFLTPNSDVLVETYIHEQGMREDKFQEILFDLDERLHKITKHVVVFGFEKAMLEKVMKHLLYKAMRDRNKFLLMKDLKWDADKITRIETRLQPRYTSHVMYHRHGMGALETELLRFPSGKKDDLIDAEQALVSLLKYPKKTLQTAQEVDKFNWWRNKAIEAKNPRKTKYIYGNKGKFQGIPALEGC